MLLKTILLPILVTMIAGCSSNFRLLDIHDKPVKGAIVVSEISDYIFQKWTIQIDVTNSNGEAENLIGREVVYKKGFHPIVNGSDISGVFNYSGERFKSIILKDNVRIYPVKLSPKYAYSMHTKWIDIEGQANKHKRKNKNINISINHCPGVLATYSSESKLITLKSDKYNLINSSRFFYESASITKKYNTLSNKEKIFFYCLNNDNSIYKTGISLTLRGGSRIRGTENLISRYFMIVMKSKINTINAYIEPRIKPTRPLKGRFIIHKRRYPKIILHKSKKEILHAINENIPSSNNEEKELKRLLLMVIEAK